MSTRKGDAAFAKMDKVNSDLFALTYGALVSQLVKDYEDVDEVNKQLDDMGYQIGQRLIEEYLSKSSAPACKDFATTAENIGKVGMKMFLGITAEIGSWDRNKKAYSLFLAQNPLEEFVELPEDLNSLNYSNIICGVIRGALEMVNIKVNVFVSKDMLKGDDITEIRIELSEILIDTAGSAYSEGL